MSLFFNSLPIINLFGRLPLSLHLFLLNEIANEQQFVFSSFMVEVVSELDNIRSFLLARLHKILKFPTQNRDTKLNDVVLW